MVIPGHISNGVVVLEGDIPLPEGAAVAVVYPARSAQTGGAAESGQPTATAPKTRVEFPLVRTGEPGSLHLTNDQIHAFLQQQDIEALKAQRNVPS